jgi:hypothetical protein
VPVVLPNTPAPASSAQAVPTVAVYDYLLNESGQPMPNQLVTIHIDTASATTITPLTQIGPKGSLSTTTDKNGYWTVNLIPNGNISPAGTTYVVETPSRSYRIVVGAAGPYQSTAPGTLQS